MSNSSSGNLSSQQFSSNNNNNDGEGNCDEKSQALPTCAQILSDSLLTNNNNAQDNRSRKDQDEWQILEASEETDYYQETQRNGELLSASESGNGLNQNQLSQQVDDINHTNKHQVGDQDQVVTALRNRRIKSVNKRFVEVDPFDETDIAQHTTLIHICTAIYALVPMIALCTVMVLFYFCFTRFFYIPLLYFGWILFNKQNCNKGGSRIDAVYRSNFYKYIAVYFNMKLRFPENFKLNAHKNYLLNYHPHGIAAFGSVSAFATNALGLSDMFEGITTRFLVHESSFLMPVMREVFGSRGDCSVNSKSIDYIFSRSNTTGNLCAIVVGGLAEADLSNAKTLKVVVKERKGFVKKALIHGADLVPCIAFGENSVFTKIDFEQDSIMRKFQDKWYELFKFKHPAYIGRSMFWSKLFGLMPFKRQITVAFGNPIRVDKCSNPSQTQIDKLHETYIKELQNLYDANKDLCVVFDQRLEIL